LRAGEKMGRGTIFCWFCRVNYSLSACDHSNANSCVARVETFPTTYYTSL
jgi:hypothetical protein